MNTSKTTSDHLAMVVEQEYPLGADGDHHRVLQRVVDHLGHLSDSCDNCFLLPTLGILQIQKSCNFTRVVHLIEHVALRPKNFPRRGIFPHKATVTCHKPSHIPLNSQSVIHLELQRCLPISQVHNIYIYLLP